MFKTYMKVIFILLLLGAVCVNSSAVASELTVPNTFSAGTPAKASEVNDNFTEVKTAVDDNFARLPMVWASTDENPAAIEVDPYVSPIETNTLTITVPSDGVITVCGSATVICYTCGTGDLTALVDGSPVTSVRGNGSHEKHYLSTMITVPITSGTHTVSQDVRVGTGRVVIDSNNLTVMFFPASQSSYSPAP